MSIKRLLNDVFERVDFLDQTVENPFLRSNEFDETFKNPFAQFFGGTYVWIEPPEQDK